MQFRGADRFFPHLLFILQRRFDDQFIVFGRIWGLLHKSRRNLYLW